ncbi:hypothetical protein CHS0354_034254 [Potamilus streckersoni]|uniref:RING-type domain-containing protein n=1 Tax=Potamilus streckersoni TaxID=2493646 RepID=A0AAE0S4N3_9BIVA|nr:hypothetical protein CHS0354_034254 [Potamilus streckersoni]
MHDSRAIKMRHMEMWFLFAMCVDLSSVSLKDRRIALVSLLDSLQDSSIIISGRRFRVILVFVNVKSKYISRLFDKMTATSSIDISNLSMKNMSIAYKKDKGKFLCLDVYICQLLRKLLLSQLDCCMKRFIFLEFNVVKVGFQAYSARDKVARSVKGIDGYTLPVAFPDLKEDPVIVVSDNYYDRPAIPNKWQGSYDGKDETRGPQKQKTQYSQFSHESTRLATFANSGFFTDPQIFAELGFFYRGQGDSVSCYECGITLSKWQTDDDPLLEHIRFSTECQHLSATLDPDILEDYKAQFQKTRADDRSWSEGVRQDKITSNAGCKIRSPQYTSFKVRLSTFANFPFISGLNVHSVAAAGFYYTGQADIVRCYACDGGLKRWEPGDDPWEEHFKWFPDCLHLEQSNFKSPRKHTKADEQSSYKSSGQHTKLEGSSEKFQDKASAVGDDKSSQGGLAGRLQEMNIGETKEHNPQKHLSEPDLSTPAALAVLELGYSQKKVQMALNELRKNGQAHFTANGILQVLFSYEDTDELTGNGEKEKIEPKTKLSVSSSIPAKNISSEESLTSAKSNKNASPNTQTVRRILEETDDLKSKMMCKRCKKNLRNMLILPCTHFCLCDHCSKEISLCPECWNPIKERVKTYIS